MGVIFEFYAVDEAVDSVRAIDPDTLLESSEQVGDISINSRAMGELVGWMLTTPLAHLVDDPDGAPAGLLVPETIARDLVQAFVPPTDDPEDVPAAFIDALEDAIEEAVWKRSGLGIVAA